MEFITSSELRKTLANEQLCVKLIDGYFKPLKEGGHFEGHLFDSLAPRSSSNPNRFEASDLLACSLLNADIKANAIVEILSENSQMYSDLLGRIPTDLDFLDVDPAIWTQPNYPGSELYAALKDIRGIKLTKATKLLARKRPALFPIIDSIVLSVTAGNEKSYWGPLSTWLQADGQYWFEKLDHIRRSSVPGDAITTIRAFDIVAWLVGTGKSSRIFSK